MASLIVSLLPLHKRATGMALFGPVPPSPPPSARPWGLADGADVPALHLFYLNAPPGLLVMAILAHGLDRKPVDWGGDQTVDLIGILTMAVGLGLLGGAGRGAARRTGSARASSCGPPSSRWWPWCSSSSASCCRHPLVNLRLLHNPRFRPGLLRLPGASMGLMGSIYAALYMTQIHNYNALENR